jgi:hypothetical protein
LETAPTSLDMLTDSEWVKVKEGEADIVDEFDSPQSFSSWVEPVKRVLDTFSAPCLFQRGQ